MKHKFYTVAHLEIQQHIIKDVPLWYLDMNNPDGMVNTFKKLKEITGYKFDNRHLKWSDIFGDMFAINVYYQMKTKTYGEQWYIHVWDAKGNTTIATITQDVVNKEEDYINNKSFEILQKKTKSYSQGIVDCSDCKKEMKNEEVSGRYFAGIFCKDCWERTWKAIEAKETYD